MDVLGADAPGAEDLMRAGLSPEGAARMLAVGVSPTSAVSQARLAALRVEDLPVLAERGMVGARGWTTTAARFIEAADGDAELAALAYWSGWDEDQVRDGVRNGTLTREELETAAAVSNGPPEQEEEVAGGRTRAPSVFTDESPAAPLRVPVFAGDAQQPRKSVFDE